MALVHKRLDKWARERNFRFMRQQSKPSSRTNTVLGAVSLQRTRVYELQLTGRRDEPTLVVSLSRHLLRRWASMQIFMSSILSIELRKYLS